MIDELDHGYVSIAPIDEKARIFDCSQTKTQREGKHLKLFERWMPSPLSWDVMMGCCVVGIRRPMTKPLHWIRKIIRSSESDVS